MAKQHKVIRHTDIQSEDGKMLARVQEEHASLNDSIIPSPEDLKALAEIDPEFPKFFMEMARSEQKARHRALDLSLERIGENTRNDYKRAIRGMNLAFLCVLLFVALCALALYMNMPWIATVVGLLSLGTVVTVFVTGKSREA